MWAGSMTRAQAEAECERRRRLIEARCILQFSAYFAARKEVFPPTLRKAVEDCSKESCRVGDLCAFERKNADEDFDFDKTPEVIYVKSK